MAGLIGVVPRANEGGDALVDAVTMP